VMSLLIRATVHKSPGEPVCRGALQQQLSQPVEVLVGKAARVAGRATALQCLGAVVLEAGMPAVHALAAHAELAGNLGLPDTGSKQFGGTQPAVLELLAINPVGRCHAGSLPHHTDPAINDYPGDLPYRFTEGTSK
jgi:hypothetical protein